jgi:hypothetical protein
VLPVTSAHLPANALPMICSLETYSDRASSYGTAALCDPAVSC